MRVHVEPTGRSASRLLAKIQVLSTAACLLCGLAATAALAGSREENSPEPPVYLDTAEGYKRFQESDSHKSIVPLSMYFVTQVTQTYCGVASSTMVLNALIPDAQRPTTPEWSPYRLFAQSNFFTDEVLKIVSRESVLKNGMILDKLGAVLRTYPVKVEVFHAGGKNDESAFRNAAKEALRSGERFVILNYLRTAVAQKTGGHFSPLAAYHGKSDSFLVYDVARYKYPPSWVKTKDLWSAMNTTDDESMMTRGYLVVKKSSH